MKINNERVYVADICRAEKSKNFIVGEKESALGCLSFEERVCEKNVICIRVGRSYVPIIHVDGLFSYLDIISHKEDENCIIESDARFMNYLPNVNGYYIKNVKPAFDNKGKTSLETLKAMNSFVATSVNENNLEPEAERE